jgi:hypothetical protein
MNISRPPLFIYAFNNLHAVQLLETKPPIHKPRPSARCPAPAISSEQNGAKHSRSKAVFASALSAADISRPFLDNHATIAPFVLCYKTPHWLNFQPGEGRS